MDFMEGFYSEKKNLRKKSFKTGLVKKSRQKNLDLIGIKSN